MLGKAEEKHQVTKEVDEQDGALPENWRGEVSSYPLLSKCGTTDDSQSAFRVVSHRTAYILDVFLDSIRFTI
jgi:hypothetical protein